MSDAADFQKALQQFRDDYARQVPERLAEARAFLRQCLAAPQDEEPLRGLHGIVHKIAGSAGTFGLKDLSVAARTLEERLDAMLLQPARTRDDFAPLQDELAGLDRLL
ncbi:hypothetical protein HHL11_21895 [Ramlibacter sp. G-1-2-2]|uniref:HPt domain-containing protein n=1 Tax=Ramlibacter agri TaxID=2728837 RepID=A0A848H7D1_9BURK|nr:Hpt domain-containing protein [Ramlibacter agri]NML46414.1 hypothetical protein [Ramlibacter agri]